MTGSTLSSELMAAPRQPQRTLSSASSHSCLRLNSCLCRPRGPQSQPECAYHATAGCRVGRPSPPTGHPDNSLLACDLAAGLLLILSTRDSCQLRQTNACCSTTCCHFTCSAAVLSGSTYRFQKAFVLACRSGSGSSTDQGWCCFDSSVVLSCCVA